MNPGNSTLYRLDMQIISITAIPTTITKRAKKQFEGFLSLKSIMNNVPIINNKANNIHLKIFSLTMKFKRYDIGSIMDIEVMGSPW